MVTCICPVIFSVTAYYKVMYDLMEILKSTAFLPHYSALTIFSSVTLAVFHVYALTDRTTGLCTAYVPSREALLPSAHLAGTYSPISAQTSLPQESLP